MQRIQKSVGRDVDESILIQGSLRRGSAVRIKIERGEPLAWVYQLQDVQRLLAREWQTSEFRQFETGSRALRSGVLRFRRCHLRARYSWIICAEDRIREDGQHLRCPRLRARATNERDGGGGRKI